jgi:hypothetical protein
MPHVYPAKYLDMVPALKDIRVATHQIPPSGSGSELNWYDGAETPAVAIGTPADNATQQVIKCKCTVQYSELLLHLCPLLSNNEMRA